MSSSEQECPRCNTPVARRVASQRPNARHAATQRVAPNNARNESGQTKEVVLSFVENGRVIAEQVLNLGTNRSLTFGSDPSNDLVVAPPSRTVSSHHGTIFVSDGWCVLADNRSLNGLYLNGSRLSTFRVAPGDVVCIGKPEPGMRRCVLAVSDAQKTRKITSLVGHDSLSVGRLDSSDLVLNDVTVSAHHALLKREGSTWTIVDLSSTNGTQVDSVFIQPGKPQPLYSGSIIRLGNSQLVFLDECLLALDSRHGVDIIAEGLVRYRKNGRSTRITTDHVSLHIKRGDFVAIVGGSGCGKSTLLNELSGGEPADEGNVFVNGADLYNNYQMLKTSIGFVPQQDIVYDNLTLNDMLSSAANLRMQTDTTREERERRIEEVIDLLDLEFVRNNLIGNLSGGQKKRASIAVELMADPRLLFLDEPTSGLDPGIERKLMQTLADMAHEGRTIVLVTHTTLNLHLCDQVVFLGRGGKLCYAGSPSEALSFFGVTDLVDIYGKIDANGAEWEKRFRSWRRNTSDSDTKGGSPEEGFGNKRTPPFGKQLSVLAVRYTKLLLNDRSRMALLLLQAPALGALISFVAGSSCFSLFEDTKSCLFALSCAAFWVGILNSIQEICKEREILSRDYEGGVRLSAYMFSKIIVLGVMCLAQSAALTATFVLLTGQPDHALIDPAIELFATLYLTMSSAMCLGLMVSALFKNPDRAIAMAPLLIMPQILFSGLVFELIGPAESISYAVTCRWAMEALGTTADLNALDLKIYGEEITVPQSDETLHDQSVHIPETTVEVDTDYGPMEVEVPAETREFEALDITVPSMTKVIDSTMIEHEHEGMYEHSLAHLLRSWGVLLGASVLCAVACLMLLALSLRH